MQTRAHTHTNYFIFPINNILLTVKSRLLLLLGGVDRGLRGLPATRCLLLCEAPRGLLAAPTLGLSLAAGLLAASEVCQSDAAMVVSFQLTVRSFHSTVKPRIPEAPVSDGEVGGDRLSDTLSFGAHCKNQNRGDMIFTQSQTLMYDIIIYTSFIPYGVNC